MKQILGVCGDSFMAAVSPGEYGSDCHFTQILAKKIDWDYITFARGGCSNPAIRLQIDEAIKIKPDLLIIGTTTPDRIELPITQVFRANGHFWESVYEKNKILSNIECNKCDLSSTLPLFENVLPTLLSETISHMLNNPGYYIERADVLGIEKSHMEKMMRVVHEYYEYVYDMNWKKQQDTWIIASGLHKLRQNNIPFFIIPKFLYDEDLQEFNINKIKHNSPLDPWSKVSSKAKARFHTSLEEQKELADNWFLFLKDKI